MNRIYRPIRTLCLCAASLCCLAACSDFLDENAYGQLPAEDFFQSKEDRSRRTTIAAPTSWRATTYRPTRRATSSPCASTTNTP